MLITSGYSQPPNIPFLLWKKSCCTTWLNALHGAKGAPSRFVYPGHFRHKHPIGFLAPPIHRGEGTSTSNPRIVFKFENRRRQNQLKCGSGIICIEDEAIWGYGLFTFAGELLQRILAAQILPAEIMIAQEKASSMSSLISLSSNFLC